MASVDRRCGVVDDVLFFFIWLSSPAEEKTGSTTLSLGRRGHLRRRLLVRSFHVLGRRPPSLDAGHANGNRQKKQPLKPLKKTGKNNSNKNQR